MSVFDRIARALDRLDDLLLQVPRVIATTSASARSRLFKSLKSILVAVSLTALVSVVTLFQAFRFDVHDLIDLELSLCRKDEQTVVKSLTDLIAREDRWDFYRVTVSLTCDDDDIPPDAKKAGPEDTQPDESNEGLKPGEISWSRNIETYSFGDGKVYASPSRSRNDGEVQYTYSLRYFKDPALQTENRILGGNFAAVRVKIAKDDTYVYNRMRLVYDTSLDIFDGPYFVSLMDDPETGRYVVLTPLPFSPEIYKAHACNKQFGGYRLRRLACSLFIG